MNDSDIIDISESWSNSGPKLNLKSSNFGEGIELLMNDKTSRGGGGGGGGQSSDINIDDLNFLEDELNNLTDNVGSRSKSDMFDMDPEPVHNVKFSSSTLGSDTSAAGSNKTWDGYDKFNDIPVDPEKVAPSGPQMSKEELLREKFKFLRRLEALETKGVNLTKKYTMESPLAEMQGEYEMIMEEKQKQNSIKFSGNMLMAAINAIEFLNNKFDPFDIKLDGWSEQINENLTDYDDVFAELFEKYKSKATMAPEIKLMFQLGGSAMMVHMTNTMFKSAMPGMDDILRQNPDLMKQFQTAAVNSMGQSSPGFSGFMNGVMGQGSSQGPSQGYSQGPPPPPMATQDPGAPNIYSRPGNNSFAPMNMGKSNFTNDGINFNIKETSPSFATSSSSSPRPQSQSQSQSQSRPQPRPEMNGPSDIEHLLSGLKTKTINIQEQPQQQQQKQQQNFQATELNDSSTISISDMKEMQAEGNTIKRSGRRKKSDKNTLSLDI